jgi:hypothetical protein
VLHFTRLEKLDRDKYSNLLGRSVSYVGNEVLLIRPPEVWVHSKEENNQLRLMTIHQKTAGLNDSRTKIKNDLFIF